MGAQHRPVTLVKTLVVAHVYYPQLWPELAACVRNIDGGRDLVITYVDEATVQADIVQVFVRVLLGADPVVGKGQVLQSGDVVKTVCDWSKAKRLFGYVPSTKFEDGIRAFVEWRRSR